MESRRARFPQLAALTILAVNASPAAAQAKQPRHLRTLAIGIAPHVVAEIGSGCARHGDQSSCTDFFAFAGVDATVHYWPLDFFAVGARFAGSKDLDAAGGVSDDGLSWDPEDQFLWRLTAELRLNPPILPVFIGAHGGLALLTESQEWHESGTEIRATSETRAAPMAGLTVGVDLWLGESFTLTPEVRGSLIAFGEPPELRAHVEGHDYGSSAWFDVALRLSYVIP